MPGTPVTWNEEQAVSAFAGDSGPSVTQLADGRLLLAWSTTNDTAPAADPGSDILGRFYDSVGAALGPAFQINSGWGDDDEGNASVAAMSDGSFVVAFEDDDGVAARIGLRLASSSGAAVASQVVQENAVAGDPSYANPRVAVSGATSVLVSYEETSGGLTTVVGRIYNPSTDLLGPKFTLLGSPASDADVAVLASGNYVVAAASASGADAAITYRILTSSGSEVVPAGFVTGTPSNGFADVDPTVAVLAGGGFVIAWTNTDAADTDVHFRIYTDAGVETASGQAALGSETNDNRAPAVVALADGSFVIAFDNDQQSRLDVEHFTAGGESLGVHHFAGAGRALSAVGLADGRFAIAWDDLAGINLEILDTRDAVNSPGVYSPEQQQIGTVGGDVFTADPGSVIVRGWSGNDTITEAAGDKRYYGDAGDDTLIVTSTIGGDRHDGGAGSDTIDWSAVAETGATFDLAAGTASDSDGHVETMLGFENLNGTEFGDEIVGTSAANALTGNGGDDLILGGAGVDILDGGGGSDSLDGGMGDDSFFVDDPSDRLVERPYEGHDTVHASVSYALGADAHVEVLSAADPSGTEAIELSGNGIVNEVRGNAGANVLHGGGGTDLLYGLAGDDLMIGDAGDDRLSGGPGDDTYLVVDAFDTIMEARGEGYDRVFTSVGLTLMPSIYNSPEVELLTTIDETGTQPINLVGSDSANTIIGNAGANRLNGLGGDDVLMGLSGDDELIDMNGTLDGGPGDDRYVVGSAATVIELADAGRDVVYARWSYVLPADAHVEVLSAATQAYPYPFEYGGNGFDNLIVGNAGNNALRGGGGNDSLVGLAGNDRLYGDEGIDVTNGGAGDDVHFVDQVYDIVIERANQGQDTVYARMSYGLTADCHVEVLATADQAGAESINLVGSGIGNRIVGNAGVNVLRGGEGNDTVVGLAGHDELIGDTGVDTTDGGFGDDWHFVDQAADVVIELAGEGRDIVYASASYTLAEAAQVELLSTATQAGSEAINLTGNSLANHVVGNAGNNVLRGGGGDDSIIGLAGDDQLVGEGGVDATDGGPGDDQHFVDNAADRVIERAGEGRDIVYTSVSYALAPGASVEALSTATQAATQAIDLIGNELTNLMVGNAGANVLDGRGGVDTLTGLAGEDSFAFTTTPAAGNVDRITDFSVADDTILLDDAVFSGLGLGALPADAFCIGAAAGDSDDRIIYNAATGSLIFDADGTGAAAAVQFATLGTGLTLGASEFLVI